MLRPNSLLFVLFAGGLLALGPLTMEMYVPALPVVASAFGADAGLTQLTVSVYLAGFAIGQLVSGPLVDVFGRRPLMLAGMTLIAIASLACVVAPSMALLIVARFAQALGVSVGQVAARAVIRDRHDATDTARMLAYSTVIIALASALSPIAGGFIAVGLGWEAVFLAHAGLAVLYLVVLWWGFDETLTRRDGLAEQIAATRAGVARLLRDRTFLGYTLSVCFMFGSMFTFISAGAFMFVDVLSMAPENFGFVFTAISGMLGVGSFLAGALARRIAPARMFVAAAFAVALCNLALAAAAFTGLASVLNLMILLAAIGFFMGIVVSLAMAGAISPHPDVAGTAAALIGFAQGAFAAGMSAVAGLVFDGTVMSVVLPMTILALGVPLSFVLLVRREELGGATARG